MENEGFEIDFKDGFAFLPFKDLFDLALLGGLVKGLMPANTVPDVKIGDQYSYLVLKVREDELETKVFDIFMETRDTYRDRVLQFSRNFTEGVCAAHI